MKKFDYVVVVNKDNPLDKNYVPENLVLYKEYNGQKIDQNYKTYVCAEVLEAFDALKTQANKLGYDFVIDSGYRSYEYQQKILRFNIDIMGNDAYSTVALPGQSEHQTGLAIDIAINTNNEYNDHFDDSYEEIKWLHENCSEFGFILRYPKGKEFITGIAYECWHLRFVGQETAKYMKEHNVQTLEEYHNLKCDKINS